ncbi:NHL repeat-containing protein [Edaphobacter bradus]|uniref:hypothetical protein n=1 Tax=Edaphobacter bradus TaxID=2259016 RepID=UPI0021E0E31C|nr:hypothetical protein [Edaphobacter bradus]
MKRLLPILLLVPALLTGCGVTPSQLAPPVATSHSLRGGVHGGQQGVAGAHVYLFAANTAAYGAASLPLLIQSDPRVSTDALGPYVTTDANGNFSLSRGYVCSAGQEAYVLVMGGNPGLQSEVTNPGLAMMAVLGPCPSDGNLGDNVPYLAVNEVTTIGAVYALSGFMTDLTHVSSGPSAASKQGLANAFATAGNLVNVGAGTANDQNLVGNGSVPQAEINTLADILVPCVNSDGTTSACSTLFNSVRAAGDTSTIADTATAALKIARNPALNISALFNLVPSAAPFQPTLATAPNDWTIGVTFFSESMGGPYYPAFDSAGNLWVPSYTASALFEFDPLGTPLDGGYGFSGGGLNVPFAVAVDSLDNVWAVNFWPLGSSSVSRFRGNGSPVTSAAYACSSACYFPAVDASGNLWVSGQTATTVLSPGGTKVATFLANSYNSGMAIDSGGHGWTLGHNQVLYRFDLSTGASTQFSESVTAASGKDLTPMAVDASNHLWLVSNRNNAIGKLNSSGTLISPPGGYTGGGLKGPAGIAVDGSGNIWVANRDGNSISAFTNTGTAITPSTGYQAQYVSGPRGIAVDLSGNVWVANFTYNSVTEFVGVATPVKTPITPSMLGQRP